MTAEIKTLRASLLLAISEVHAGNGAEGQRIADAALATFGAWLRSDEAAQIHAEAAVDTWIARMPRLAGTKPVSDDEVVAHEILARLADSLTGSAKGETADE